MKTNFKVGELKLDPAPKINISKFERVYLPKLRRFAGKDVVINDDNNCIEGVGYKYFDLSKLFGTKYVRKMPTPDIRLRIMEGRWKFMKQSQNWNWWVRVQGWKKSSENKWQPYPFQVGSNTQ